MSQWNAALYLENGHLFKGIGHGRPHSRGGEIIFNTAMAGYQEVFSDPSYKNQMVVLTYPHIGNYGINSTDDESDGFHIAGVIVKELCAEPSHPFSEKSLGEALESQSVPVIEGLDTRELTRIVRSEGAQRAVIFPIEEQSSDRTTLIALGKKHLESVAPMEGQELVSQVSCKKLYEFEPLALGLEKEKQKILVYDFGVKTNTLRHFKKRGFQVWVAPYNYDAQAALALEPHAIVLSNGPGDPKEVSTSVEVIKKLVGKVPLFAICMGHQLLAQALGATTYKLKFGHHGVNHPVRDERTGRVLITSQNHGFAVSRQSLEAIEGVELTHVNLNDGTVQGFMSQGFKLMSFQFHPESAPGPTDAAYLFDEFIKGYLR